MNGNAERIENGATFFMGMPGDISKGHGIRLVTPDQENIPQQSLNRKEKFARAVEWVNKKYGNVLKRLAE